MLVLRHCSDNQVVCVFCVVTDRHPTALVPTKTFTGLVPTHCTVMQKIRNHFSFMDKCFNMHCNLTEFSTLIVNECYCRWFFFNFINSH